MATARLSQLLLLLLLAAAVVRGDPPHSYHRAERRDPDPVAVPFHLHQQRGGDGGAATPSRDPHPVLVDSCSDEGSDGTCIQPEALADDEPPQSSSLSPSVSAASTEAAVPTGAYYCLQSSVNEGYEIFSTLGSRACFYDEPHATGGDTDSDFVFPHLQPGDVVPILWRESGKIVTQYAFQVGLPPALPTALLDYANELGIIDLLREYTAEPSKDEEEGEEGGEFLRPDGGTGTNELWHLQYPSEETKSNLHSIGPADEKTHEECLRSALAAGEFDVVLEAIGTSLGTDSLAVYQVAFEGVSYSEGVHQHDAITGTSGGAYKIIVPLILADGTAQDLLWDDAAEQYEEYDEEEEGAETLRGGLRHRIGTGILLGDDALHGVGAFDYRNHTNPEHRSVVTATIYIGEIYQENVEAIAETLYQTFPQKDGYEQSWLMAQEGRHWSRLESGSGPSLAEDAGRKAFRSDDESSDCEDRADDGLCEQVSTRLECPFSCQVYIQEGPTRVARAENEDDVTVCVQNRTGMESCSVYSDTPTLGDFVTPDLSPGEVFPFVWRDDKAQAVPYAFLVGLPPELSTTLRKYCDELGITDAMRELTGPKPLDPGTNMFYELNGNDWYVQRPPAKWTSNMHWISPADEATHEEYLRVLASGNFDLVLNAIGSYLGLEGLAAYHLTFIGVSHSEKGFMHRDTHHTGASVYNVIIPLILEDDTAELAMADDLPPFEKGALKYKMGIAALMGDDAMHGTEACDYRANNGMRLAATVYIADIDENNAEKIAEQTLTQIFPLKSEDWLLAQKGRHWDGNGGDASLARDEGRAPFEVEDKLDDCEERAAEGLCYVDDGGEKGYETRRACLKSCGIYQADEGVGVIEEASGRVDRIEKAREKR